MGAAVSTPIKSEADRQKMLAFFRKHWRRLPEKITKGYHGYYTDPQPAEDMAYASKEKCSIGFQYNDYYTGCEYVFAVCCWMALKVGKQFRFPKRDAKNTKGMWPVIRYDGYETWPVLPDKHPSAATDGIMVDDLGVKTRPQKWHNKLLVKRAVVRKEMQRLDNLWKKENP